MRRDKGEKKGILEFRKRSEFIHESKSTVGMEKYITFIHESEKYCEEKEYEDNGKYQCLKYHSKSASWKRNINTPIHRNEQCEYKYEVHGRSNKDFCKGITYKTQSFRGLKLGGQNGGEEHKYPYSENRSEESTIDTS